MSPGPRLTFGLSEEEEEVDLGGEEAIFGQAEAEEAAIAPANSSRLSMMVVVGDVDSSSWDGELERLVILLC